jgi:hypothetical protein
MAPPAPSNRKVPSGKRTVQLKKKLKRKQPRPRVAKTPNDTRKPTMSTPKLDEKLRELVEEHYNFVSDHSDKIYQEVVKYMENHTVAELCEIVKAGMPDFWKGQIEEDEVDLDALGHWLLDWPWTSSFTQTSPWSQELVSRLEAEMPDANEHCMQESRLHGMERPRAEHGVIPWAALGQKAYTFTM